MGAEFSLAWWTRTLAPRGQLAWPRGTLRGAALLPRHGAKMLWVGREKPTSDPPWTLAASAAHDAAAAEGNEDQRTSGGGDVGEDIDEDYGAADRVMSAAPFPAIRPLEPLTVGR